MYAALARFEVVGEVADIGFIVEALTVEGDRSGSEIEGFCHPLYSIRHLSMMGPLGPI